MDKTLSRKNFLKLAGCACMCAAAAETTNLIAQTSTTPIPGEKTNERAVKRLEFVDHWLKRFFDVVDQTLDEPTRKKLMTTNGKSCYKSWIQESNQQPKKISFEEWAKTAAERHKNDKGFKLEGRTITMQFNASAETGTNSPERICLCPTAESLPTGLSGTYCSCSLGYVKEMYETTFDRPVEVELLDSVIKGGNRCKFKVTVS